MLVLSRIPSQFQDAQGNNLAGGSITVKLHQSSKLAEVFADIDGETELANPVRLDSMGHANMFVQANLVLDYEIKDRRNRTILTYSGIMSGSGEGFKVLGYVNTIGDLPASASTGDAYIVENSGNPRIYAYFGSWQDCGAVGGSGPQGERGTCYYPTIDVQYCTRASLDAIIIGELPITNIRINKQLSPRVGDKLLVQYMITDENNACQMVMYNITNVVDAFTAWRVSGTYENAVTAQKGAKGDKGDTGAQGIQGPQGNPGQNGTNGRDGVDGTNGRDGADGEDGADGISPEVQISSIPGGHRIRITDATHPEGQYFDVMDGTADPNKMDTDGSNATSAALGNLVSAAATYPLNNYYLNATGGFTPVDMSSRMRINGGGATSDALRAIMMAGTAKTDALNDVHTFAIKANGSETEISWENVKSQMKTAFGIDASGSATKFLNEAGSFVAMPTDTTRMQTNGSNATYTAAANIINAQYAQTGEMQSDEYIPTTRGKRLWTTIVDKMKSALGISSSGSSTKFLNQQGTFSTIGGAVDSHLGISSSGSATKFLNEVGNFVEASGSTSAIEFATIEGTAKYGWKLCEQAASASDAGASSFLLTLRKVTSINGEFSSATFLINIASNGTKLQCSMINLTPYQNQGNCESGSYVHGTTFDKVKLAYSAVSSDKRNFYVMLNYTGGWTTDTWCSASLLPLKVHSNCTIKGTMIGTVTDIDDYWSAKVIPVYDNTDNIASQVGSASKPNYVTNQGVIKNCGFEVKTGGGISKIQLGTWTASSDTICLL